MRYGRLVLIATTVLSIGLGSAWAQIAVTDPATTARNAVTALLKGRILDTVTAQYERLRRMARRLSAHTNLEKYAASNPPQWHTRALEHEFASGYDRALRTGDQTGAEYTRVARTRRPPGDLLAGLSPAAREAVEHLLATLDAADSTLIVSTHQVGMLRSSGGEEAAAINHLEAHALDPSLQQSATAVLDKISAAALIEARQKQARLHLLAGIVEQLLVENKRARDTEAAVLNMQLGRLRDGVWDGESGGWLAGASEDLRTWRQP